MSVSVQGTPLHALLTFDRGISSCTGHTLIGKGAHLPLILPLITETKPRTRATRVEQHNRYLSAQLSDELAWVLQRRRGSEQTSTSLLVFTSHCFASSPRLCATMGHSVWHVFLLGSFICVAAFADIKHGVDSEASVTTASAGLIVGHQAPGIPEVFEFLGIPYAEAPTGQRRFAPPVRRQAASNATFHASTWVSGIFLCSWRSV